MQSLGTQSGNGSLRKLWTLGASIMPWNSPISRSTCVPRLSQRTYTTVHRYADCSTSTRISVSTGNETWRMESDGCPGNGLIRLSGNYHGRSHCNFWECSCCWRAGSDERNVSSHYRPSSTTSTTTGANSGTRSSTSTSSSSPENNEEEQISREPDTEDRSYSMSKVPQDSEHSAYVSGHM